MGPILPPASPTPHQPTPPKKVKATGVHTYES